jgi:hypothetical protein
MSKSFKQWLIHGLPLVNAITRVTYFVPRRVCN